MPRSFRRLALGCVWICLALSVADAQEHGAASSSSTPQQSSAQQNQPENPNAEFGGELSTASKEAAKEASTDDAKVAMELKAEHSPIVSWIGRVIGIGPEGAYVLSLLINFGILVAFFWILYYL